MKTDQLIVALVADRGTGPFGRRLTLSLLISGLVSLALFLAFFGPRHDLAEALTTWRFDFKIVLMVLTVALAFGFCRAVARPVAPAHPGRSLLLPLAAVLVALAIELAVVPRASWGVRLVGSNSMICLTAIPLLSLAPLVATLTILRSGAPASPALAGAAAGLLAAACGATLYAFHCFDDSPLFVVTWYTLAALGVIGVGTVAGHRLLRW